MSIQAKVILDSLNGDNGIRLTTMELTYPRFIHAEFMTHRLFSRNAASSRAIPVGKVLSGMLENPATPIHWGKNQKGMSADEQLNEDTRLQAGKFWFNARDGVIAWARALVDMGLHKQLTNRMLEPWQNIVVICSATHWTNFFRLRDHKDAQPEIQELARAMKVAQTNSSPSVRDWHIPYIWDDEQHLPLETKCKISTARCARVSYLTHDGRRSIEDDLVLHERLMTGSDHGHWSPFEHVAKQTSKTWNYYDFAKDEIRNEPIWCGNFQGWVQYRKLHTGEHLK